MSTEPAQTFEVGYGKPPKQHRFTKGRSGNPGGRPKKKSTQDLPGLLKKALDETVVLNENGRRKSATKREAFTKQLVNKAVSGDHRAMKLVIELLNQAPEEKAKPIVLYQMVGDDKL